jgi:hypothetical protein
MMDNKVSQRDADRGRVMVGGRKNAPHPAVLDLQILHRHIRGVEQLDGPVLAGPVDSGQRAGAVGADRDRAGACARRRKDKRSAARGATVEKQAVATGSACWRFVPVSGWACLSD